MPTGCHADQVLTDLDRVHLAGMLGDHPAPGPRRRLRERPATPRYGRDPRHPGTIPADIEQGYNEAT